MKVHHLNCATLCPPLAALAVHPTGHIVCHCLLVETDRGLVLVDTGIGLADLAAPRDRLGSGFLRLLGPRLDPEETAARRIERLGFALSDVRHVIVTHLDADHAGALADFPEADVHVFDLEHAAATHPPTFAEKQRYRPALFAHGPRWVRHEARGGRWMGFEAVHDLAGLPPEILLVPLCGHTRGHCGVAVDTGRGWLLHCGDAYLQGDEVKRHGARGRVLPGISLVQRLDDVDHGARVWNQARLRKLAAERAHEVRLFCAHDPDEHAALAAG